jgi:hypothetical protein
MGNLRQHRYGDPGPRGRLRLGLALATAAVGVLASACGGSAASRSLAGSAAGNSLAPVPRPAAAPAAGSATAGPAVSGTAASGPAASGAAAPGAAASGSVAAGPVAVPAWVRNVHAPCSREAHNFPTSPRPGEGPHRKPTDETELCGTRRHGRYDGYKSG